jgi:ElaB/YqjD/DUF883 family membrane-anchored ribosome-binding protein
MALDTKPSALDNPYRTDAQKAGERSSYAEHKSDVSGAMKEVGDKASNAMDYAADKAHTIGETIADRAEHTHSAICAYTKSNPTTAVLLAFGLGAILARLLPGR